MLGVPSLSSNPGSAHTSCFTIMSKSGELENGVKRILRTYNVNLKDFVKENLERIAGDFHAQGLITQTTVDAMNVIGVPPFQLASHLVNTCQSSLVCSPEQKFPRFIAILKNYETMEDLAEKMEAEFKQAGMSSCTWTFSALMVLFQGI